MSNLSEIKHLDPDNRWARLQLNRDRELLAARVLGVVLASLGAAAAVVAITLRVRRR